MGRIIVLDEHTANQIAAGEVVERPASVFKELVENAVDAGAAHISADIRNGGVGQIRVTDDGEGFHEDDALLAFERHATSKIRAADDLDGVLTLGFRGEALPSIAAVAKVRLTTRRREAALGRTIEIHGGRLVLDERAGCPAGTTISVSELFYNTPARYKFLRKDTAEAAQISDVAARLAIGRPDISFRLTSQSSTLLYTPGTGSLADAVHAALGADVLAALAPVEYTDGAYSVKGFWGRPESARSNRNYQFFYVNGRHIKNRSLYQAVEEAYRTHVMRGKHPIVVLSVTMDARMLDVNAHPAKTEVRFVNDSELFRVVFHALSTAFNQDGGDFRAAGAPLGTAAQASGAPRVQRAPQAERVAPSAQYRFAEAANQNVAADAGAAAAVPPLGAFVQLGGERLAAADVSLRENVESAFAVHSLSPPQSPPLHSPSQPPPLSQMQSPSPLPLLPQPQAFAAADQQIAANAVPTPTDGAPHAEISATAPSSAVSSVVSSTVPPAAPAGFSGAKIVGQAFGTYVLVERGGELCLIDQHAVHERVIFERLKAQAEARESSESQMMLAPIAIDLLSDEMLLVRESEELLRQAGFDFEEFGHGALLLRGVPIYMERPDAKGFFLDVLELLRKDHKAVNALTAREETLYGIACKAAVKANRTLGAEEMAGIASSLDAIPEPRTCPHGRPLVVALSKHELDRRFKRIV